MIWPKVVDRRAHFEGFYTRGDGCWEWTRARYRRGYGLYWADGKHIPAHRFSYQMYVGPIPPGMFVCHRCDNPGCVRPDHLFVGTHSDNMRDMMKKGRHPAALPGFGAWTARQRHRTLGPTQPGGACVHGHARTSDNLVYDFAANVYRCRECRTADYRRSEERKRQRRLARLTVGSTSAA